MRKHKVESRLLCYEQLFNASRIKENKTVPPLGKKKVTTWRNTITSIAYMPLASEPVIIFNAVDG